MPYNVSYKLWNDTCFQVITLESRGNYVFMECVFETANSTTPSRTRKKISKTEFEEMAFAMDMNAFSIKYNASKYDESGNNLGMYVTGIEVDGINIGNIICVSIFGFLAIILALSSAIIAKRLSLTCKHFDCTNKVDFKVLEPEINEKEKQ